MTYLSFLALFLVVPLGLVAAGVMFMARQGRPLSSAAPIALLAHIALALAYTTPWDNYLVATRVWAYDPARVLGVTLGWVPLEEYLFFVLQTLLSGLIALALARRLPTAGLAPSGRPLRTVATLALAAVWFAAVLALAAAWKPGTYLALVLVWALPPIALQVAVGGDVLWRNRRAVLAALLSVTLFLSAADFLAIRAGIWTIDPRQSLNLFIGGELPIEEVVFFLLTNMLVVFGLTLSLAPEMWERWGQLKAAFVRRPRMGEMERSPAHGGAMTPLPAGPGPAAGWHALRALVRGRSLLPALSALHADLGDTFRLPFPGFSPVVLAGPEAARFVLVDARHDFRWRIETDPVARLLRHGVLVEDGAAHDALRALLNPALHRRLMEQQAQAMGAAADEVARGWRDGQAIAVLPQMRRTALLILTRTLFGADIAPDLDRLWRSILRTLAYIAPGPWLLWPGVPRLGYGRALRQMDEYLLRLISTRRAASKPRDDLLGILVDSGLSDALIRDQLLTLLIAGHDTAAATLTWALVALGQHPQVLARARAEARAALAGEPAVAGNPHALPYLEQVIKETLRLYPPIHMANRRAARDLEFGGRRIPAGTRVLFSIFLTQRHPRDWPEPERFDPERFTLEATAPPAPFSYLPFGGGPRFCLGAAMAQVEVKMVLARWLQTFDLHLEPARTGLRMQATLEPSTEIRMTVRRS